MEPQTGSSIRFSTFALELPSFLFLLCSSSYSSWLGPREAPVYVSVCMSVTKTPVMAITRGSVPKRGFTPFLLQSWLTRGEPTYLGRFPFPIRTGRERSFPFFSFLLLVYLIVYCRSFNESLFKLYRSHSFLTFSPLIVRLKLISLFLNKIVHQDKRITMVNNKHH